MATQRQRIADPNEALAGAGAPGQLQAQDTFGVSTARPSSQTNALNTLAKFGDKLSVEAIQQQQQSDFVAGQALRAAGGTLQGSEPPPSRKGYKALDAKLRAQEWHFEQKRLIDNGENDIDPAEYTQMLGEKFKGLLTGDTETDQILTASMGQYASELGRYHAEANTKKRIADGVTQATSDVRNHILAIQQAKDSGDPVGEEAARESLLSTLTLPTVQNEGIRQQLSSDLAIMGLEMGDPAVLNYMRESGVEFTPQQERKLISAVAGYNAKEKRKLDTKYQNDTADFESALLTAKSQEEFRELRDTYADTWPDRVTNDYLINQEAAWRRNFSKAAQNKIHSDAYINGNLAKANVSNKQMQKTIDSVNAAILSDPTLDPSDAEALKRTYWKGNGIRHNSLATELTAGLSVPLQDGVLHPNFDAAYNKAFEYYKEAPDLLMKHLPEEQQKMFLDVRAATTYGGLELGDAVTALEAHRVNAKQLTREEREDYSKAIDGAVDAVLGKGFFNFQHGPFTSLNNDAEVRTRLSNIAQFALSQGMRDPEAAVEFARTQILATHEQLGDALVFNDGTPYHERMGIPANRVEDAMDFMYDQLSAQDPSITRDDTVLLGDPKSDKLLIGVKNEFGVITRTVPAGMKAVGENFRAVVMQPEYEQDLRQEAISVQNNEDRMALRQAAIDTGIYNEDTADAALSNIIGATVLEARVAAFQEEQADQALVQRFGVESEEELEEIKQAQSVFSPGITLNPEQIALLENGDMQGYLATLGQTVPVGAELIEQPVSTESPKAFFQSIESSASQVLSGTGIRPELAMAMAALETGFGKSVKGENFFGIKGKGQEFVTHEVIDGERVKITDQFRKFTGFRDSVEGLKELLTTNPRYSKVLEADTPQAQARALQEAGYATDPKYADKLISILKRID